jgi:choline dehydrogenase-like flavoprotein
MRGIPGGDAVVHGRELRRGFRDSCDVVVVGSGAGGATVATHLAEAGLDVLILEEGPYIRRRDYQRFTPSESIRRLFREAGMLAAIGIGQTPLIALTVGRAVGGSSLLTGGVCFRIPGDIHARWVGELGLDELSEKHLEASYEDVERRMAVTSVPEAMRSESTKRFVTGAQRMGIDMVPTRRNTGHGCEGNARCNFGCPIGAKRSVEASYLPSAVGHGARIVSDALVEEVITKGGRAVGVRGRVLGGRYGAPSARFEVRARAVVTSCGTIHTPMLLQKLGLRSYGLGRYITLHPGARIVARFKDPIVGWNGALQSAYSNDFHHDGIMLMSVYTAVNVIAAALPGVGPELNRRARDMPNYALFGAMIHDEGGGRVRRSPGREPNLSYKMAPRDLARLRRGMRLLCEMALEAGAEEVITPIFGFPAVSRRAHLDALEHDPLDARRIECLAFHPLGSARMGRDAREGTVDQNGECFGLPGLFVADGSVLPTSIGVNSQVPIMAMATRIAWRLRDRFDGAFHRIP